MGISTVLSVTYGFDVGDDDSEYIELVVDGMNRVTALGAPGLNVIDFLPFRRCSVLILEQRPQYANVFFFQCNTCHRGFLVHG